MCNLSSLFYIVRTSTPFLQLVKDVHAAITTPSGRFRSERERKHTLQMEQWSTAAHSPSPAAGPPREKTPSGRCSGLSREKRPIGRAGGTRRNFHRRDTWANEVMPRGETRAARASTPAQPSDGPPARIWPLPPRYALSHGHERIKASESLGSVRFGSASGVECSRASGRIRAVHRFCGRPRPAASRLERAAAGSGLWHAHWGLFVSETEIVRTP